MDKYMLSYRKQREAEAKAYEENIADHQHSWKETYLDIRRVSMLQIKCVGCGEIMDHEDIASRLNAVECLSAKDADKAASFMTQWAWIQTAIPHDEERISALCNYAKALRKSNG